MVAGAPRGDPRVPERVAALAADRSVRAVWENEIGGITFELAGAEDRRFVKWAPPSHRPMLEAEARRLRWAGRLTAVPFVLEAGHDERGSWLLTQGLPGDNAVSPTWRAQPAIAVRAIGEGLRTFHDTLPVTTCPFSWSAEERVADARTRVHQGEIDTTRCMLVGTSVSLEDALTAVAVPPPVDRLVVCHGDACAPNTLVAPDGRWSGHVDLGGLGIADRWADLAVATWSLEWNYGPGWEPLLLDAYGIDPDPERTAYYRLLWDLGP
jgi:kanamycin kinase